MKATTLTITLDQDGFRVTGPVGDPITCFGMLELARCQIQRKMEQDTETKSKIQKPNGAINPARLRIQD